MKHSFFLIALCAVLLTGCFDSGTSVYDSDGNRVGSVDVESEDRATVYTRNGDRVGYVENNDVYDTNDRRVGRIVSGTRLEDRDGERVGELYSQTRCRNRDETTIGTLSSDIDDQAAGGACLLLLLL